MPAQRRALIVDISDAQYFQAITLQLGIIVIIQAIQANEGMALTQQGSTQMKSDKAGGSCDKNFHSKNFRLPR